MLQQQQVLVGQPQLAMVVLLAVALVAGVSPLCAQLSLGMEVQGRIVRVAPRLSFPVLRTRHECSPWSSTRQALGSASSGTACST